MCFIELRVFLDKYVNIKQKIIIAIRLFDFINFSNHKKKNNRLLKYNSNKCQ